MKTVTMLEFRRNAKGVLSRIRRGQTLVLSYRGKPIATINPLAEVPVSEQDPFYRLGDAAVGEGLSLTNREMDAIIYGA